MAFKSAMYANPISAPGDRTTKAFGFNYHPIYTWATHSMGGSMAHVWINVKSVLDSCDECKRIKT